jgi:hypothetical protein
MMTRCCRISFALAILVCALARPVPAVAQARGATQTDANGFKAGDTVQVDTAFGWVDGQIVSAIGNEYRVRVATGTVVSKTYPNELHRKGPYTDRDHAVGLYDLRDRVQVLVQGKWIDGEVITTRALEYEVQLPGNRSVWASGANIRFVAAKAAPVAAKGGVPPKPGFTSCSGKVEGRYATTGGFGNFQITFRSGKATIAAGLGDDEVMECWMMGDKIILHKPGEPSATDMPMDLNLDGSLQTPLGEIKKKGN